MAYCPSACSYRVMFSDGTIMYPNLPGHVNVYEVAKQYAKEVLTKTKNDPVTVTNVERIR